MSLNITPKILSNCYIHTVNNQLKLIAGLPFKVFKENAQDRKNISFLHFLLFFLRKAFVLGGEVRGGGKLLYSNMLSFKSCVMATFRVSFHNFSSDLV